MTVHAPLSAEHPCHLCRWIGLALPGPEALRQIQQLNLPRSSGARDVASPRPPPLPPRPSPVPSALARPSPPSPRPSPYLEGYLEYTKIVLSNKIIVKDLVSDWLVTIHVT